MHLTTSLITTLLIFICINPVHALTLANTPLDDQIILNNQPRLVLNGAGIRKIFFTNIYIAALYLENPSQNIEQILYSKERKRISLIFLYDEVTAEKLKQGWLEVLLITTNPNNWQVYKRV